MERPQGSPARSRRHLLLAVRGSPHRALSRPSGKSSTVSHTPIPRYVTRTRIKSFGADSSAEQWWRGPIAKLISGPEATHGGDVAIWTGMAVAIIVYLPTRFAERRMFGR